MKKALYLFAFVAGAAVGAVAGITYVKKNYDISEKTESSKKDSVSSTKIEKPEVDESDEEDEEEIVRQTNANILKSIKDPDKREHVKNLLDKYATAVSIYGGDDTVMNAEPYKIRQDQFSEFEDYSAIELTLYSDGVLADDRDEVVENADELLGKGFEKLFDEGEDELYIRNDDRCADYAIFKDVQTFDAYDESRPHFTVED